MQLKIISGRKQIAALIGVSIQTLEAWDKLKPLPRLGPPKSHLKVLEEELIQWMKDLRSTQESISIL